MARRSSLGPFPKTHRFHELAALSGCSIAASDSLLEDLRRRIENNLRDPQTLRATTFFVALLIASRSPNPEAALRPFGIIWTGTPERTLLNFAGNHPAAAKTLRGLIDGAKSQGAIDDSHELWRHVRQFDRAGFCNLGRHFFANLFEFELKQLFQENALIVPDHLLEQHAWEMSKITQSFSARWFQKCAVDAHPDAGSIRWYLGHCLGKLDMELERELSTHTEPLPNPFRRRKKSEPPSLGLGI